MSAEKAAWSAGARACPVPWLVPVLLCLALAGCLVTPRPVFDATNSVPAAESPVFMAFVERWEAWVGKDDSPRGLIGEGARVVELDGLALVQEPTDGGASYYVLGVMGVRPVACVPDSNGIEALAAAHGVTVRVEARSETEPAVPPTVHADGPDAALVDFIREAHGTGRPVCTSERRGG